MNVSFVSKRPGHSALERPLTGARIAERALRLAPDGPSATALAARCRRGSPPPRRQRGPGCPGDAGAPGAHRPSREAAAPAGDHRGPRMDCRGAVDRAGRAPAGTRRLLTGRAPGSARTRFSLGGGHMAP